MTGISPPPITVGIPTVPHRSLEQTLNSVNNAAATYEAPISLFVASEQKPSAIDETSFSDISNVRWIETCGTAHASRQAILEVSTTDWILFTDDDCLLDEDIFAAYASQLASFRNEDLGALYGRIQFSGEKSLTFSASQSLGAGPFTIGDEQQEVRWAPTANALISREKALEVGGFDTSNPVPVSGGDVDIGLQITQEYPAYTVPNAVVFHSTETWNSIRTNLRRFYRYGKSEAWLVDKYPQFRINKWDKKEIFEPPSFGRSLPWFIRPFLAVLAPFPLPIWYDDWSNEPLPRLFLIFILAELFTLANSLGYHLEVTRSEKYNLNLLSNRFLLPLP